MAFSYDTSAPERNIAVRLDLTADEFAEIAKAAKKLDMAPVEYIWHVATCAAAGLADVPRDRLFGRLLDIEWDDDGLGARPARRRTRSKRAA